VKQVPLLDSFLKH